MAEIIIVDGYNALNAWPSLTVLRGENFEHARDKLIDILAEYGALKGIEVIIVFDAHRVKGKRKEETVPGAKIIFTKEHETADHYIERLLSQLPPRSQVWVATGDAVEQSIVLGKGACRLTIRELFFQVEGDKKVSRQHYRRPVEGHCLDGRLEDDVRRYLEKLRRAEE